MTVRVEGAQQVIKALRELGSDKARVVIRRSTDKLAARAVKQIKSNAPVHPKDIVRDDKKVTKKGTLKRAIKKKQKKARNKQTKFQSNIEIEHGKDKKNDAYYWHFVEYGTTKSRAKPFIKPVEDASKQTAERDMLEMLETEVMRELQRRIDG